MPAADPLIRPDATLVAPNPLTGSDRELEMFGG
jgi:hypothetical protein